MIKGKEIPKLQGNTFLKSGNALRKNPLNFLIETDKKFPGILHWKFLHLDVVQLTDPVLVRFILQTNQKHYVKSTMYNQLKLLLGQGLVTSEGKLWKSQRKLIQPSFHKQYINNLFDEMLNCANEIISDWKADVANGGKIDFAEEMNKVTLQIIGKTMLSTDFRTESKSVGITLTYLLKAMEKRVLRGVNFPIWIPTSENVAFKNNVKVLDDIIYKLISDRRKTGHTKGDLLDMLKSALFVYAAFIFLTVYSYTSLMDKSRYAWLTELLRLFCAFGIINFYGGWFTLNNFIQHGTIIVSVYFAFSALVSLAFGYFEFRTDTAFIEAGA